MRRTLTRLGWTALVLLAAAVCSAGPESFTATVTPVDNQSYFPAAQSLIAGARKSVLGIFYSISFYQHPGKSPSNRLLAELANAAARGVAVEIILNPRDKNNEEPGPDNLPAARYLSARGVAVYFAPGETTTHAKLLVVDGRYVILGSTNWSYRGLTANHETAGVLDSEGLAAHYAKYFADLRKDSTACPKDQDRPAAGKAPPTGP